MGKDSYLILDIEDSPEASPAGNWMSSYDPRRWEEVKIEFTVQPGNKSVEKKVLKQEKAAETYPETDRRLDSERRGRSDRRMGSRDRRSWQDSRWIGAPDCRSGQTDRRQGGDRRVNPDRRRK